MEKFIWNKHDVCVNPEVIKVENAKGYVAISLAMHNGKWMTGFDYSLRIGTENETPCGGAGLPSFNGVFFHNKEDAIIYAYDKLLNYIKHKPTLVKLATQNKEKFFQLSLF